MSLRVFNNTPANTIWSNFTANNVAMEKAMGHLATGVKTVLDDPSGVGISERMRSQARNIAMARNNVDNGISMMQTADSWLQKINDMLSRLSELAVEANDGTKGAADRANIQIEFSQMQDEIARITSKNTTAAKFNGLYLFRGGNGIAIVSNDGVQSGNITLQVGPDEAQQVTLSLNDLQITNTEIIGSIVTYIYNSLHSVTASTRTDVEWASLIDSSKLSVNSSGAVGKLATAVDFVANSRALFGAQQNRLEQTRSGLLSYEDNLRSAESKIRDIDMAQESTAFAKYQILTQIGNAMLAQANQIPNQILQLIG